MTVGARVMRSELVVCVGTGGVGKTTVAAAIALGAAMRGRRVAVLTIDPARQLARSLGLDALSPGGQPVPKTALAAAGLTLTGALDAGMLDQKRAWDELIGRLIGNPTARARVLANPFYQQLSSSFPGSNEYMAIEEVCRLVESARYDLVVLDTPPASHALEFLRAPERIGHLLDGSVLGWLARPYDAGRSALRSVSGVAGWVVRRIERAAGSSSVRDASDFIGAVAERAGALAARSLQARALLAAETTSFVLVARPQPLVLAETTALAAQLAGLGSPLAAVVANRVRAAPAITDAALGAAIADLDADVADWLRWVVADARGEAGEQRALLTELRARLPATIEWAEVAEGDTDVHGLPQLAAIADALW